MAQGAISGNTIHNLAGIPEIAAQFPAYTDY